MLPSLRVLVLAARPKTLWAGIAPVVLGAAFAWDAGVFHGLSVTLALLASIFIQVGTNYYNDLADHLKGADREDRQGPTRATASGQATPSQMKAATILAFALAVIAGAYLMIRGGWPIVLIGFSAIAFGFLYTAGRYSLSYLGVADFFVLVYFGPVAVAGTYYVQALEVSEQVIFAGFAPGLWSVALLLVNNIRDREQDAGVGKKTLVVRLGRANAVGLYAACTGVALMTPVLLIMWTFSHHFALLSLLVLIPLYSQYRVVSDPEKSEQLNDVLATTARMLLAHTLLFAVGWMLPTWW